MAEIMVSLDVCLSVCLSVCAVDRSIRPVSALNANSSKTVKATYFKFDTHAYRDNADVIY